MPSTSRASLSISAMKACNARAALCGSPPCMQFNAPFHSDVALLRACSRTVSMVFAPMPRTGSIHDPLEGGVVRPARDEPQISERILDFCAFEKTQAPIHPIGHACIQECLFENTRLRIRAIQHCHLAPRAAVRHPFADPIHDEIGLVALVERRIELDALSILAAGPQCLAEPAGIVGDQRIRRLQYGARGTIVLLELVKHRLRKIAAKMLQVLHPRAAPAIDGLIVVADHERQAVPARPAT